MDKYHVVESIQFQGELLCVKIDGQDYEFDLKKHSEKLLNANEKIRNHYQLSPSGYGISWPDIDEDLSIDGLLGIKHDKISINNAV